MRFVAREVPVWGHLVRVGQLDLILEGQHLTNRLSQDVVSSLRSLDEMPYCSLTLKGRVERSQYLPADEHLSQTGSVSSPSTSVRAISAPVESD